jgi:PAS domain S-box-containing protein
MTTEICTKILLVEDAPTDAALIVRELKKSGLQFTSECVDRQDTLVQALRDFGPDIVLCDNRLPGFDAGRAMQIVHESRDDLPIVIVTGTMDDEAAVALVKAGASDFVRKDRLGRLPVAVGLALGNAKQRRLQKEFDTAVRASELRHRRCFETAFDGILVADAKTREIFDVNQSLVNLLGYTRTEYCGRRLEDFGFLKTEDGPEHRVRMMEDTGDPYRSDDLVLHAKDGRALVVEYAAVVFPIGDDLAVQVSVRDISERKCFEKVLRDKNRELEAANLAKDRFLASMSHEIRTPLNGIIGYTSILLMRLAGDLTAKQEEQLKTIRLCGNHLLSLISDLLNLAKIGAGQFDLIQEAVDCGEVLEEVAAALGPLAAAKGLKLTIKVPGAKVIITTSHRVLWQIVTNLVSNAIKFTSAGQICLELRSIATNNDKRTEIAVQDTGIGIRAEDQGKLFGAFSRIYDFATRGEEGTGLGLHTSQKLAALIDGKITATSEYHKGSTFTLMLRDGGKP